MTQAQIIASSTALVGDAGETLFATILGILPTWLNFAIPIVLVLILVSYFLFRARLKR